MAVPRGTVEYTPQSDTYTGALAYNEVSPDDTSYSVKLGVTGGEVTHWEETVMVNHGGEHHFALFDADSKLLLDYIVFTPKVVVSVNANDDGVVSGDRISGIADVPEVVVRVTDEDNENVYVSDPVDVKNGRWWHRITAPLAAQVYSIFLETSDGTPLFEGDYQPE
jgi:hypothetical protein